MVHKILHYCPFICRSDRKLRLVTILFGFVMLVMSCEVIQTVLHCANKSVNSLNESNLKHLALKHQVRRTLFYEETIFKLL